MTRPLTLLLGALCLFYPVQASDDGVIPNKTTVIQDPTGQARPDGPGCQPYVNIQFPDAPPPSQNLNGVTYTVNLGDVCGNWQAKPQVIPVLPPPKA